MVVKDIVMSVWPALPGPSCHTNGLCPPTLDAFTIHPSGPLCIRKVIQDLAPDSMAREVKLRHGDLPILEFRQSDGEGGGVVIQTALKVFVPLATDVVRDENSGYPSLQ